MAAVAAALGALFVRGRLPPGGEGIAAAAGRRPAAWRLANESLTVFDARGAVLFEHSFGSPLGGPASSEASPALVGPGAFVTRGPGGERRLWAAFTHNLMFPTVLRELDPRDGTVRQEYWSSQTVQEETWSGRHVVLVGGTNNDFRAVSLAVFPPGAVTGSTPAVRPGYACRDCAPGGPEALFLVPSLCISRRAGQATVTETWAENGDRIRVAPADASVGVADIYYTLGPGGTLLGAEVSREFQAQHALLERRGVLDHPFGPGDDADVLSVRSWDGRGFVDLPRVPVRH